MTGACPKDWGPLATEVLLPNMLNLSHWTDGGDAAAEATTAGESMASLGRMV
jgi:hypothetical protein